MAPRKKATKKKATKKKTTAKKTATKARKKPGRKKGGNGMLLVASKTKEALKAHDCNVGSDAIDGLNQWVEWLIDQAATRTLANGRKTVRAHDFMVMS